MNEHGFIKAVHGKLPKSDLLSWKIHDQFAGGVPDAFYAGPAGILFVEYKYVPKLPAKDTTVLRTSLSTQQKLWLDRFHEFGHPCAVIIGCEQRAVVLESRDWNHDLFKSDFVKRAVNFADAAAYITNICIGAK